MTEVRTVRCLFCDTAVEVMWRSHKEHDQEHDLHIHTVLMCGKATGDDDNDVSCDCWGSIATDGTTPYIETHFLYDDEIQQIPLLNSIRRAVEQEKT